ncbi:MAG: hypothetical protein M3Z05_19670 [Gemmatimonadota bacterium]|nr:hypothetical protein [Gemmatimonadota bacterium]
MTMPSNRHTRAATVIAAVALNACVAGHNPLAAWQRPSEISREWVDVEKSTPDDTTLWVLGPDGYDGVAHLQREPDATGVPRQSRKEKRYGSWYLDGTMGDSTHQAICFSRRIGRFGATCTAFVLDTIMNGSVATPRLLLHAYRGSQHTRDRLLLARATAVRP